MKVEERVMEKLTVIVPVYNSSKYLKKCIESILEQTYVNTEIILVNDGSTDNSIDICKEFKQIDNRIIVIDKENGGVASARNAGLEVATGSYVAFVDSDDYVEKDMYETMIEALNNNNADIVECGFNQINIEENKKKSRFMRKQILIGNSDCLLQLSKSENTFNSCCNKIYRSELIGDMRFKDWRYSEDFFFNFLLYFKCKKKVTLDKCYYNYLINFEGAMHSEFNLSKLQNIEARKQAYSKTKSIGLEEQSLYFGRQVILETLYVYLSLLKSDKFSCSIFEEKLDYELNYFTKIIPKKYLEKVHKKTKLYLLLFKLSPNLFKYSGSVFSKFVKE